MFQPDLFTKDTLAEGATLPADIVTLRVEQGQKRNAAVARPANVDDLDLPAVLERLARISTRPRYTFMVLNLIARAAGRSNSAGPYVQEKAPAIPVRDWLSGALIPMAQRDVRRRAVVDQVRYDLADKGMLPSDSPAAEQCIAAEDRERLLHSGRANVSRAVSDLVRGGLIHRHYQGYRVDHSIAAPSARRSTRSCQPFSALWVKALPANPRSD